MRIGIPKETKQFEGRVSLTPEACATLVEHGHEVWLQSAAGEKSGFPDHRYRSCGVNIAPDLAATYEQCEMVVKVKEPIEEDLQHLRADHRLFCYLHLAAEPKLTQRLLDIGVTAVAFETVSDEQGRLPLLAPMSEIAGRLSMQVATHLLHQPQGGKGILLGGTGQARTGRVVVIGGGVAGLGAAAVAAGIGADVTVFDQKPEALARAEAISHNEVGNVSGRLAEPALIDDYVRAADVVIGAVLLPGAKAPKIVSSSVVAQMEPGSVVVDIAVDQGGCIETSRPTDYSDPTYVWEGVTHFCVTNMPGAVPYTASQALSGVILPYVLKFAEADWQEHAGLAAGLNVAQGRLVLPALQLQN